MVVDALVLYGVKHVAPLFIRKAIDNQADILWVSHARNTYLFLSMPLGKKCKDCFHLLAGVKGRGTHFVHIYGALKSLK